MPRPKRNDSGTFSTFDDLRTLVPNLGDYIIKSITDPTEQKNYIQRCLKLANDWINNELEAAELHTYAKTNNKKLAEANYAVYLILRGTVRGERAEQNTWLQGFKDDAEKELEKIKKRSAATPGHSSRTEKFSKSRVLLKSHVGHKNRGHGDGGQHL